MHFFFQNQKGKKKKVKTLHSLLSLHSHQTSLCTDIYFVTIEGLYCTCCPVTYLSDLVYLTYSQSVCRSLFIVL